MSEKIWFRDPSILFTPEAWSQFVPMQNMSTTEALNSVVRFTVYFSVLLYIATGVGGYILAIPVIMLATIVLHKLFPNGKVLENFVSNLSKAPTSKNTMPTASNPFMNPLLTEIADNPNRPNAANVSRKDVKAEIYKEFQQTSDLYMDTSDMFDQAQAMRTFHTVQSGSIPNDQEGFLKWLSKGLDEPDYSSTAPARGAKLLSEGHVTAKGAIRLPSTTDEPSGVTPAGAK
jgi:hypothetical protein